MTYAVKEIFYTLQGEGANAGRPAVFCRFSGCNLWSGREEDRLNADCNFCDTDFVGTNGSGGGKFRTPDELAATIFQQWPADAPVHAIPLVVCTGGEPLLQLDESLLQALHARGLQVAIETNGTLAVPTGVDWICVSPKGRTRLVQQKGNELKLVFPQVGVDPAQFERLDFEHFFLQPMDGPHRGRNTDDAVSYCLTNPRWRLSLQTHKLLEIP